MDTGEPSTSDSLVLATAINDRASCVGLVELLSENPAALARYPVGTEYDWEDEVTPASDVGDAEGAGSDFDLDFAFAPPVSAAKLVPADDIFAHGRIVPAYPVFDRNFLDLSPGDVAEPASTAAPSTDTYCAWTPRSAPSSPSLDIAARSTRGNCNSETTAKGVPAASTVVEREGKGKEKRGEEGGAHVMSNRYNRDFTLYMNLTLA
uniref:Uncharacterized protein n=1 Tax=Oryza rufipogon TaxID=4529 RepID=A0A0E0NZZ5_ORYRU